ncbi:pyruvate kinase 1, cytosolic-like [Arachis hypogaea]|uniref:pyruvate kinase 1, cytosolic-like n=1 Tax=Arachis hypogaea TaxID=3818 RepID=UPI000DED35EF
MDSSRGVLSGTMDKFKMVFLFRKSALYKCNMAGKPTVLTRVVDSMTDNLRPTRAEATDVANAVLDGTDAILLGAETLRGLHPIETSSTFGRICSESVCYPTKPDGHEIRKTKLKTMIEVSRGSE